MDNNKIIVNIKKFGIEAKGRKELLKHLDGERGKR